MPAKKRHLTAINPAVAALGVGADPEKWTGAAIINRLSTRYTDLVKLAHDEEDLGRNNRARLFWAQAAELAALISQYHQEHADAASYDRWEHRRTRAESTAFRTRNAVAESIGAGSGD